MAVEALRDLDYPADKFEILLVRGTQPSKQRNLGIAGAAGEVIYFLDNDSSATRQLLLSVMPRFRDPRVLGVGGPNVSTVSEGVVPAAVDAVFCSVFGTGSIRARYAPVGGVRVASEHDIIFCNLSIRAQALKEAGGLNEELYPNEENELFERLLDKFQGSFFLYDPHAVVKRPRSETVLGHAMQIFRYGVGRMKQTFYRFSFLCVLHLAPAAFLLYLLVIPWLGKWWLWAPAWLYAVLVVLFSAWEGARRRSLRVVAALLGLFPLTHVAYGAGLLVGFIRYAFLRWRPRTGAADLMVVKKFGESIGGT
ncbi:MAG: hypothetical protein V2A58_01055 [Planctomycetota bacterium]